MGCKQSVLNKMEEREAKTKEFYKLKTSGQDYKNERDLIKAELCFSKAFNLSRELFGDDHGETVAVMSELAVCYIQVGSPNPESLSKLAETEKLYKGIITTVSKKYGEKDPLTLTATNNLAGIYLKFGLFSEAENIFQYTLRGREQVLGVDDPHTISTRNNLAFTYCKSQKYKEAEDLYVDIYKHKSETYGEGHEETLRALNNLGVVYRSQRKYEDALNTFTSGLALSEGLKNKNPRDCRYFLKVFSKGLKAVQKDSKIKCPQIKQECACTLGYL